MPSFYSGKKILVTGGSGFIGSFLVEALVKEGALVRVSQRNIPDERLKAVADKIEFVKADFLVLQDCLKAVKGTEMVFNLAAQVGGVQYNIKHPATMFFKNSIISLNMLEAARTEGVERFMCTSSTCVYARQAKVPTIEKDGFKDDPEPSNIGYGWAKRVAELDAQFYAKEFGMKIALVRPANIYGPRDTFDPETAHVIPDLIRRVYESQDSISVWGDGKQTRAFIYVKDVINAMMLTTEKYAICEPLNIGTDEEVTITELIEKIIRLSNKKLTIEYDLSKPQGQPRKAADIMKIKQALGWKPAYSLEEGLKETIQWYRDNCARK